MDYPQLHLPERIINIINTKEYQKPVEPIEPKEPIKANNTILKLIIIIIGISVIYFKYPLIGFILITSAGYWLIKNPEKNANFLALKKY